MNELIPREKLNPLTLERLKTKLVDTVIHQKRIEDDKKASMASFTEEMKAAKARIDALASAIKNEDQTLLLGPFNEYEVEDLIRL